MPEDRPTDRELETLRRIATFQFGPGAADALLGSSDAPSSTLSVTRTTSGRIEQLFADGDRLATMATNGRFVLSVRGARRLLAGIEPPRHRVVVGAESVEYVRAGRNAFAKFVQSVDPGLRPADEAILLHDGEVLGVGRAALDPGAMADFDTGVAVEIRHGAGD